MPFGLAAIDDHSDHLVAYWHMEETGVANRVDEIGTNDLVPANAPGTRAGILNLACDFIPGSAQALSVAHNADLSPTTGFAVSVWAYLDDMNTFRMLLAKGVAGYYLFRRNANDVELFITQTNDATPNTNTGPESLMGDYHNVVAMACDGFLRIFVNGVESAPAVAYDNTFKVIDAPFYVGRFGSGATPHYYDGGEDEMAFWRNISFADAAARNAFVAGLWNGGAGRFWAPPTPPPPPPPTEEGDYILGVQRRLKRKTRFTGRGL